jgi:hypothetical protein
MIIPMAFERFASSSGLASDVFAIVPKSLAVAGNVGGRRQRGSRVRSLTKPFLVRHDVETSCFLKQR